MMAATSAARAFRAVQARPLLAAARQLRTTQSSAAGAPVTMVERLEQMSVLPWYRSGPMRLAGMFSEKQFQCAAGEDLHRLCVKRASDSSIYAPTMGAVDEERFFARFQVKGLHCWLVHVRLREMARSKCEHLFNELMERLWEYDAMRDIVEHEGLELLQALKYQKELQLSWHGLVQSLDIALQSEPPREAMAEVLLRNVYAGPDGDLPPDARPAALWLADYLLAQVAHARSIPDQEVLRGRLSWAPPPPARQAGAAASL